MRASRLRFPLLLLPNINMPVALMVMVSSGWPFASSLALGSRFSPALKHSVRISHDVDEPSDTTSARAHYVQGGLLSQQLSSNFRVPFGSLSVSVESDFNYACNDFLIVPLRRHTRIPHFYSYPCKAVMLRLGTLLRLIRVKRETASIQPSCKESMNIDSQDGKRRLSLMSQKRDPFFGDSMAVLTLSTSIIVANQNTSENKCFSSSSLCQLQRSRKAAIVCERISCSNNVLQSHHPKNSNIATATRSRKVTKMKNQTY